MLRNSLEIYPWHRLIPKSLLVEVNNLYPVVMPDMASVSKQYIVMPLNSVFASLLSLEIIQDL